MAAAKPVELPVGFTFSPTDEQLVLAYLRRRAAGDSFRHTFVVDVDFKQHNPWDLVPEGVMNERYVFTRTERKWPGSRRTNRAAGDGYWRATGSETPVYAVLAVPSVVGAGARVVVGMRRSLVFYHGKSPTGERTPWVTHEYRLADAGLLPYPLMRPRAGAGLVDGVAPPCRCAANAIAKKNGGIVAVMVNPDPSWVICRVYKKKMRAPRVNVQTGSTSTGGGVVGHFIDFLGQAPREPSPAPSCLSATPLVKQEDDVDNMDKKFGIFGGTK